MENNPTNKLKNWAVQITNNYIKIFNTLNYYGNGNPQ